VSACALSEARTAFRAVAGSVLAPTVLSYVGQGAVLPALALLAVQLGASVHEAAFVVAALGVGQLLGAIPAGVLAGRFGDRRVLIGSSVATASCWATAAFAPTAWLLAALVLAAGVCSASFDVARQTFVAEVVPFGVRARVMSTLGGMARAGLFVGPLLGAAAQRTPMGLRAALLVGAAGALAAAVPLLLSRSRSSGAAAVRAPGEAPLPVWVVARRHARTLATLGLLMAVISAARATRPVLIPLWAAHIGLSPATTSLLFALAGGLELLLFYPAGSLMDRFGRRAVAVPCAGLMGVGLAVLPLAGALPALMVAVALLAAGSGLGSGIVKTVGADAAPATDRAAFLGLWSTIAEAGSTGGPLLVAGIAVLSLATASLTLGAVTLLSAVALGRHWGAPALSVDLAVSSGSSRQS
jgi:MFS family permease